MASPDEKFESDAKRVKSRNFGGYLKDRITGSADFEKKGPSDTPAQTLRDKQIEDAEKKALGYKRGGSVKKPSFKW